MTKILLLGHINTGKTTVAEYLKNKYHLSVGALGTSVKKFYVSLFDVLNEIDPKYEKVNYEDLFDRSKKEQHRQYLQNLSNKLMKPMFGNDIWLKSLSDCDVIEDIRFKYEYEYYNKRYNTTTIKIYRDLEIKNDDISEHDMDNFTPDFEIYNNSTLEELYKQVDDIVTIIMSQS